MSILREKDVFNYPFKALRELLMNACMHRDYQSNMPTRLYQYDSHIEIMNPGGLYGQARPENFPHVNDYRNSVVAEMMKTLNYVNMFNHGVSDVQALLRDNDSPAAEFNVNYLTVFSVIVREPVDDTKDTWLTIRTNSVWAAVITHGAINGFAAAPLFFIADNTHSLIGPTATGLLGMSAFVVVAIIVSVKYRNYSLLVSPRPSKHSQ